MTEVRQISNINKNLARLARLLNPKENFSVYLHLRNSNILFQDLVNSPTLAGAQSFALFFLPDL